MPMSRSSFMRPAAFPVYCLYYTIGTGQLCVMFDGGAQVMLKITGAEVLWFRGLLRLLAVKIRKPELLSEFNAVFQNGAAFTLDILAEGGRPGAFDAVQDRADLRGVIFFGAEQTIALKTISFGFDFIETIAGAHTDQLHNVTLVFESKQGAAQWENHVR